MTENRRDDDDDWPEPIQSEEELQRAKRAFADTLGLRRRVLRYAYVALSLLVVLVIVLALTR